MSTAGRPGGRAPAPLPDLPLPADPDLALPSIYVPPPTDSLGFDDDTASRRRIRPPVGERDHDRPLPAPVVAAARAIPSVLVVGVAGAAYVGRGLLPATDLPVIMLLVVVIQVLGFLASRANDLLPWSRSFITNAAVVLSLVPMLAIQANTTRIPYVSTEFGTALPAILATVAASVGLVTAAIAAVAMGWEEPGDAALLLLPTSLLVPAILGTSLGAAEPEIARLLAEAYGLVALTTFLSLLSPLAIRLFSGALCLGVYFGILIALSRGPTIEPTSDRLARILDGSLLATDIFLTAAVPLLALATRRVMRIVREEERIALFDSLDG